MKRKKAVKIRKWVTCTAPSCKRRALSGKVLCGKHQAVEMIAETSATAYRQKKRAVRKKTKQRKAGKAAISTLSRLIKAYCEKCGYTIRLSKKWIEVKRPMCPACLKNMVTEIDGAPIADSRQLKLKKVKKGRADPKAAAKISATFEGRL